MHLQHFAWLALLLGACLQRAESFSLTNPYKENSGNTINRYDFVSNMTSPLANKTESWVVSLIGLNYLLHLLYLGAEGPLKFKVLKAMHLEPNANSDDQLAGYISKLKGISEVKSSNALVARYDSIQPTSEFVAKLVENQSATIFAKIESGTNVHSPEKENLDQWMEDASGGTMHEMDISDNTAVALINVVYLNLAWGFEFEEKRVPGTFKNKNVEVMTVEKYFDMYPGDGFDAIRLPFEGGKLSAIIVIKNDPSNPSDSRIHLDSQTLNELRFELFGEFKKKLTLKMPSFRLKYRRDYSESLLNLPELSGAGLAKFGFEGTGLDSALNKVSQQVFLKVDETGTEAASSTGFLALLTSRVETFAVDEPFHYLIVANPAEPRNRESPMEVLFEAFVTKVDEKKQF